MRDYKMDHQDLLHRFVQGEHDNILGVHRVHWDAAFREQDPVRLHLWMDNAWVQAAVAYAQEDSVAWRAALTVLADRTAQVPAVPGLSPALRQAGLAAARVLGRPPQVRASPEDASPDGVVLRLLDRPGMPEASLDLLLLECAPGVAFDEARLFVAAARAIVREDPDELDRILLHLDVLNRARLLKTLLRWSRSRPIETSAGALVNLPMMAILQGARAAGMEVAAWPFYDIDWAT